jgi:hypothetical protein
MNQRMSHIIEKQSYWNNPNTQQGSYQICGQYNKSKPDVTGTICSDIYQHQAVLQDHLTKD